MRARTRRASLDLRRALCARTARWEASCEDGFVCVCGDASQDEWVFFPVSRIEAGRVALVHDQAVGPRPLTAVEAWSRLGFRIKGRASLDAVYALCWRPFQGLAAARAAMAEVLGVRDQFSPGAGAGSAAPLLDGGAAG